MLVKLSRCCPLSEFGSRYRLRRVPACYSNPQGIEASVDYERVGL